MAHRNLPLSHFGLLQHQCSPLQVSLFSYPYVLHRHLLFVRLRFSNLTLGLGEGPGCETVALRSLAGSHNATDVQLIAGAFLVEGGRGRGGRGRGRVLVPYSLQVHGK